MHGLRFCAYQYQHLPLDELRRRWVEADELGFDVLWNVDAVVEPDRPRHVMFDAPTTLAMMAAATSRIRVGTLVSSLYFRQPVTLAKAATTLDHLSGGRVEVALGVGDPSAGDQAAGVTWSAGERVARFAEFVELVDLLLRQEVTSYQGKYYRCESAETIPLPVQRPRPPLTIAAHGPRMLRIAARVADGWSSWGGYDVETVEDFYRVTSERCERFDDLASAVGRDPRRIRHSVVCFPPLTPWESVDYFTDMVGRFVAMGVDELVLYWPGTWRDEPEMEIFHEVAATVLPRLRRQASADAGDTPT
jgi:alkanesulfonate monooxygenase SsuD/methylene tetrahydromethanopterin reductase-like flavin-dependent oxidoreductase (luciferase family)